MNTFTCCKCDASSHLMSIEFRIVFSTSRGTLFTFPAVRREIWLSHWQPTFDCEIKVPADVLTTFFYFKLNAVRGRKCKSPRQRDVTWASAARSDAFTPRGPQTKSKPIGQKDDISFFYNLFQIKHESQRKSIDVSLNFGRNTRMNRCRRFKSAEKFKIHFQRQRIHWEMQVAVKLEITSKWRKPITRHWPSEISRASAIFPWLRKGAHLHNQW